MTDSIGSSHPNVRSSKYIIIESRIRCHSCEAVTAVFAFSLPLGYESRYVDDDTPIDEHGEWEAAPMAAVLSYVEYLPDSVVQRVCALTRHYRLAPDDATGRGFWMNHCEHCGAAMEEEELHGESGGPFSPIWSEGLAAIRLHQVREPFEAWAGGESHDVKPMDS